MGKIRTNTRNPNPKRESSEMKYAYGIFRRWNNEVRLYYAYDDSVSKTSKVVKWADLPEDVKQVPEIAELNPDNKPV